ncbi:MAG: ABC transporter permease [Actinomycetota bacterium]|nr:ABC transporter permease [Actinomycetota bacterium]
MAADTPTSSTASSDTPAIGRRRPTPGWRRVLSAYLARYRHLWKASVTTSVLTPLAFLGAMGLGLGTLVDDGTGDLGAATSYLAFVAPGILAASTAQIAASESTFPVMGDFRWDKTNHAALATPLTVNEMVHGWVAWLAVRLTPTALPFVVVMAVASLLESPIGVLALPVAVLGGLALGTPIAAYTATQETEETFTVIFRMIVLPLFLFSGTMFPADQLPGVVHAIVAVAPIYHAAALARALALDTVEPAAAALHLAVLVAWTGAGIALMRRTFTRRLIT